MDTRMLWKVLLVIIATATSASELMGAYGQETGGGNAGGPTRRYNAPMEAPRRSEPYYHRSPFKNNLDPRDRLPKAERELAPGHSLSKAKEASLWNIAPPTVLLNLFPHGPRRISLQ